MTLPLLPSAWGAKDPDNTVLRLIVTSCSDMERERLEKQLVARAWASSVFDAGQPRVYSVHPMVRTLHLLRTIPSVGDDKLRSAVLHYRRQFARQYPKLAELISLITNPWVALASVATFEDFALLATTLNADMKTLERDCEAVLQKKYTVKVLLDSGAHLIDH